MAYVVKKAGRYLSGHSYATGIGYKFSWTPDPSFARRFADDEEVYADGFASQTNGHKVHVMNTPDEIRALGKRKAKRNLVALTTAKLARFGVSFADGKVIYGT